MADSCPVLLARVVCCEYLVLLCSLASFSSRCTGERGLPLHLLALNTGQPRSVAAHPHNCQLPVRDTPRSSSTAMFTGPFPSQVSTCHRAGADNTRGRFVSATAPIPSGTFLGLYNGRLQCSKVAMRSAQRHEAEGRGCFQLFFNHSGKTMW